MRRFRFNLDKLSNNKQDEDVLNLTCLNRDEAIKVFEQYKKDKDKIVY